MHTYVHRQVISADGNDDVTHQRGRTTPIDPTAPGTLLASFVTLLADILIETSSIALI